VEANRSETCETNGAPAAWCGAGDEQQGRTYVMVATAKGREEETRQRTEKEENRKKKKRGWERYSPRAPCPSSCLLGRVNQRARRRVIILRDTSHVATTCVSLISLHCRHAPRGPPYHTRAHRAPCSTIEGARTREKGREKKRGDSHEKRASEITRYAHGHTKHVQHVALITTDCPVHLPFRRYRGAAGTDRRGKPPVILTWRTLAVARRATAHASNEARREI